MSKLNFGRQNATSFATYTSSSNNPEHTGVESHFEDSYKPKRSVRINHEDELFNAETRYSPLKNSTIPNANSTETRFFDDFEDAAEHHSTYNNHNKTRKFHDNFERHFHTRRNSYEVEYVEVEEPAKPAYVSKREVDEVTTETTTQKIEMPKTTKFVETVERVETVVPKPEKKIVKKITRKPQTVQVVENVRENICEPRFVERVRDNTRSCCDDCSHHTTTRRVISRPACTNRRSTTKKVVCFEMDEEPAYHHRGHDNLLAHEMYEYYEVPAPSQRVQKIVYSEPKRHHRSNYFCESDCWKSSSKPCPLCRGTGVVSGSTKKVYSGWGASAMNAVKHLGSYSGGYNSWGEYYQPSNPTALYWKEHGNGRWGRGW